MQRSRYIEIEKLTSNILSKQGILKPAIPIEQVATNLGITLECYDLGEEISGMLVLNGESATIGYNSSNISQRQRFTIAHELAHYILHKPKNNDIFIDKDFLVKYRSDKKYTEKEIKQEQEANAFAASILMPKQFIMKEMISSSTSSLNETELIAALSNLFDVSVPAMTFRLGNLDILG